MVVKVKPQRSVMQRRFVSGAACAVAVLATAACGDPGGVELGHNWSGAETFVLVRVDNLTTVVGIDPQKLAAEALAAVPTQKDDDNVNSPSMSRLAGDRWIVVIPKVGGKPSRVYRVDKKDKTLDVAGTMEAGRTLIPAGNLAVAVGAASRAAGKPDALLYEPESWHTRRTIPLPMDPKVQSANQDNLCIAGAKGAASAVVTSPLGGSTASHLSDVSGSPVQAIDCSAGYVTIAQGPGGTPPATEPSLVLEQKDGIQVVTTSAGRVDQLFSDRTSITAAVSIPQGIRVITIRRSDGGEIGRVRVNGFADASAMQRSREGWLIFSGNRAALAKTGATDAVTFSLPGQLLAVN